MKQRNATQLLRAARRLLGEPTAWTKRTLARDGRGAPQTVQSAEATAFCPVGALLRIARPGEGIFAAWMCLRDTCGGYVSTYNDDPRRTHVEVMAWIDRAIVLSKAYGK